ncbi:hypothetical protein X949_4040 [Burkholderia pseudomallei MSHR5609]|nr:hypothetical protein X949_4040 [Burkholderia pseudomallei MSHR5609]
MTTPNFRKLESTASIVGGDGRERVPLTNLNRLQQLVLRQRTHIRRKPQRAHLSQCGNDRRRSRRIKHTGSLLGPVEFRIVPGRGNRNSSLGNHCSRPLLMTPQGKPL